MPNSDSLLAVDIQQETAWVTIRCERDRNSLNSPLMAAMAATLDELESAGVRAAVFAGEGETHFIGGADGVEMMQCDPSGARRFSRRIQGLFERMEASPLVLVAAIDGLCFGGGFEFAMACDLRAATTASRIGLPEVKVGLIPGGGGTQRLPQLVGVGRALDMILSGTLYSAAEALTMGLVQRVVERETLKATIDEWLARILRHPDYAIQNAKRAVYASRQASHPAGLAVEREAFSACFHHRFFKDLMHRQLRENILSTTADVAALRQKES